jgi:hypothetical protein
MVGSHLVPSRSKSDMIDRFFSWGEKTFCPHDTVKNTIPLQEDNLDFVFEQVESLVCREDVMEDKQTRGQPVTFKRDNSLVEACNSIQAKLVKRKSSPEMETSKRRNGKMMGEGRDVLDYCFDHVESYACGENATGTLVLTEEKSRRGTETVVSPSPMEDIESEIHLYYRPS